MESLSEPEARIILSASLTGVVSRLGALISILSLASLGALTASDTAAVAISYAVAEIAVRSSESKLEESMGKRRRGWAALATAKSALRAHTVYLIPPSLAFYAASIYASLKAWETLSSVLAILSLSLMLWWRGLASALAARAGLTQRALRASMAVPGLSILLVLLTHPKGGGLWGLLALSTGYAASVMILYLTLKAAGLTAATGSAGILAVIGMPDMSSIASAVKYAVAALICIYTGNAASLLIALAFDSAMRIAAMFSTRSSMWRLAALAHLVAAPLYLDPPTLGFAAALSAAGLVGVGFQSPLRGILTV